MAEDKSMHLSGSLRKRLLHQLTHTELMSSKLEKLIDLYRDLCKIPTVLSGSIAKNVDEPRTITISSTWAQTDIVRNEEIKFHRKYFVQLEQDQKSSKVVYRSDPEELNEVQRRTTSSNHYTAVLRNVLPTKRSSSAKAPEKTDILDVYNNKIGAKECSIDLKSAEKHGKIHSGECGRMEWSHGEGHLLYVAAKFRKPTNFFDPKFESEKFDDDNEEFLFRESWGEQMSEVVEPVICILDVPSGNVTVLDDLSSDISPIQPVWSPNDEGIIFVGLQNNPAKLGYIYCFNRRSRLYYYRLDTAICEPLSENDAAIKCIRFAPDGSKFVHIECAWGGAHKKGELLKVTSWPSKECQTVLDLVDIPENEDSYPGLYDPDLPSRCWANDNKRVIMKTVWRSKTELIVVNVETGRIVKITNIGNVHGCWNVLDVFDDLILASCSSPNRPPCLLLAHLPADGHEDALVWLKLDRDNPHPFERLVQDISWEILGFSRTATEGEDKVLDGLQYEGILLRPKKARAPTPLIVVPHGGPHSVSTVNWINNMAFFVSLGYSVLRLNYRGSIGFGEKFLHSLPSKVGTTDVLDCQHAVEATLDGREENLNKNAVILFGASHGGFLTAHLIGQYPDFYQAAVALNPVINLAAKIQDTDIPDSAYFECFNENYNLKKPVNGEQLAIMFDKSPIKHVEKVKTPIMFLIGDKDLRVPPNQIKEYVRILNARQQTARVLWYPENNHPISAVDANSNFLINVVRWFEEYLSSELEKDD